MEGILIGTGILWVLNAILVVPLAKMTVTRRLVAAGVMEAQMDQLSESDQIRWRREAVKAYVLWDVIVLGIAGLIGGLLGFWFVGVSFEARGWPGMLTFIAASFLGLAMASG